MTDETVTVSVDADTSAFDRALTDLEKRSSSFGRSLTSALKGAITSGQGLEDVLRSLAGSLAGSALSAGLQPLQSLASSAIGGLTSGISSIMPFAKGGVVSSPTYFGMGSGSLGLTGEAGAEAILPLARGADGRLGVATGGGGSPVQVVFNMTSPDASSFRKSEAQVSTMLAGAVRRGARRL
ncbi:phage tail tape measure protein [Brucella haematophila]|uniref:phage tail tape measure protein n=1 Tax=Brucella haematophila TaxID=419474 RepID=UPI00110F47E9|nr:phage tail tape measure protein [Brucella haematophila]KAB2697967.1 phage tail tape measure protein [Ochrobactrum sp. Kaboul]TMV01513.1 phage tail tape measure protein [Brucella haematophila]